MFNSEVSVIMQHISTNLLYPQSFLYDLLYKFLDSVDYVKTPVFGPQKLVQLVTLPFVDFNICRQATRLLKAINSKINPHIKLKFIFVNNFKISSLFPFKDRFPISMRSHVVYELDCITCSAAYIGLTNRLLPSRVKEHRASLTKGTFSSVAEHVKQTNHIIAWDSVKILASDPIEINLSYLESLLIKSNRPILNNKQSSIKLNLF